MDQLIEKVAAGLRAMKNKPDAFLCCFTGDLTWDLPEILGIPVFHSAYIDNTFTDDYVPFIPMWNDEKDYSADRKLFDDHFTDYCVKYVF